MLIRFLIYGMIGWCMEIIWTGIHSLLKRDFKLVGNSSIWMFFIYGSVVFFEPICDLVEMFPVVFRGGVYAACIFAIEYITGSFLKRVDACPWDYSASKYNVAGVIRLDYLPVWFSVGLIFETIYHFLI